MKSIIKKKVYFFIGYFSIFIFTYIFAQTSNFLDTIYKATEEGVNQTAESFQIIEQTQNIQPSLKQEDLNLESNYEKANYQFQCPNRLSKEQLEEIIRQIIEQIINSSVGCGTRIVIVRIPTSSSTSVGTCPGSSIKPPSPPSYPTQPTKPPSSQTSATGSVGISGNVSEIAGLKSEIKAKFGIEAASGIGADWTKRQLEEAIKVLETLPPKFRNCTKKIQRDARGLPGMPSGVLGWVQPGIPTVHILNAACYQGTFQGTLVHEMSHCFQAVYPNIQREFERKFWPYGRWGGPISPSVSAYGNTQPVEDFAESCRMYWQAGKIMKQRFPDRYQFLKQYVFDGIEY